MAQSGAETKARMGEDFDYKIQLAASYAQNGGVSFALWNLDHIEVFSILEFVPLYSEETGALIAGIRFWQIAPDKPLRATLYELDGYTEYIQRESEEMTILKEKRAYKLKFRTSPLDGTEILDGENYPAFPIVPLYNINRQSELVGNKEVIDAYDLMASQLINNIDDGNVIYWVLKNMDGMDDAKFIEQLKTTHVAHADGSSDGSGVDAHTVEIPYEASETALERLRMQLFDDFMALDVKLFQGGDVTATQIKAAYEPLNEKADLMEHHLLMFVKGILAVAGIEDKPTFQRSKIVNQFEETEMILQSANFLDDETILRKLPFLSEDEVEIVLKNRARDEVQRYRKSETKLQWKKANGEIENEDANEFSGIESGNATETGTEKNPAM